MSNFSFKTVKPTGRYKAFGNTSHYIKLGKAVVGEIVDKEWRIRLMVVKADIDENGNSNCVWKWITLAARPATLDEAKKFLTEHIKAINTKYNLYKQLQ